MKSPRRFIPAYYLYFLSLIINFLFFGCSGRDDTENEALVRRAFDIISTTHDNLSLKLNNDETLNVIVYAGSNVWDFDQEGTFLFNMTFEDLQLHETEDGIVEYSCLLPSAAVLSLILLENQPRNSRTKIEIPGMADVLFKGSFSIIRINTNSSYIDLGDGKNPISLYLNLRYGKLRPSWNNAMYLPTEQKVKYYIDIYDAVAKAYGDARDDSYYLSNARTTEGIAVIKYFLDIDNERISSQVKTQNFNENITRFFKYAVNIIIGLAIVIPIIYFLLLDLIISIRCWFWAKINGLFKYSKLHTIDSNQDYFRGYTSLGEIISLFRNPVLLVGDKLLGFWSMLDNPTFKIKNNSTKIGWALAVIGRSICNICSPDEVKSSDLRFERLNDRRNKILKDFNKMNEILNNLKQLKKTAPPKAETRTLDRKISYANKAMNIIQ